MGEFISGYLTELALTFENASQRSRERERESEREPKRPCHDKSLDCLFIKPCTFDCCEVFIYEMILVSFRVPRKVARDMLFIVSFFQMFFQLWLFMFMAKALKQIESLPYLVGAT